MVLVSEGCTSLQLVRKDVHMNQQRRKEFLSWPKHYGYRQKWVKVTVTWTSEHFCGVWFWKRGLAIVWQICIVWMTCCLCPSASACLSLCLPLPRPPCWLSGLGVGLEISRPGFDSCLQRGSFFGSSQHQWLENWHSRGYPTRHLALKGQCWDWSAWCQYTAGMGTDRRSADFRWKNKMSTPKNKTVRSN